MPRTPKTVFKYQDFSTLSLLNLKKQSVYFASPRQFNDPYDCAITASIVDPTPDDLERAREFLLIEPSARTRGNADLESLPRDQLREVLVNAANQHLNKVRSDFLNKHGICCFSERNDALLMWSHYGGRCKGMCLEFRTDFEPFNKLQKVEYVKAMPSLHLASIYSEDNEAYLEALCCTKSKAWAYEEEWRALHIVTGTTFTYKPAALKAVYFGPDMEDQACAIVCVVLGEQNKGVKFWMGTRSSTEFEVQFKRFTYISHNDAKSQGMLESTEDE